MKEDWEIQTVLLEVDAVTCFQDLSNRTGMSVVIMFFSFGMSVVITSVLPCWCLWSLLMFFSVGRSVVITGTYFLQCWYVCGHYLLLIIFFSTDWFEGPLAQIQVKFPWQLILMIKLTPYNSNPCLLQPCTINSS